MRPITVRDQVVIQASDGTIWAAVQHALQTRWHPFIERIEGHHTLEAVRVCDLSVRGKAGRKKETCVL